MFIQTGDDFIRQCDDPGVSGLDVDESEAIKTILSRSTKLQSLDGSSELLRTLHDLTSSFAPMKRHKLWSSSMRVCIIGVFLLYVCRLILL